MQAGDDNGIATIIAKMSLIILYMHIADEGQICHHDTEVQADDDSGS